MTRPRASFAVTFLRQCFLAFSAIYGLGTAGLAAASWQPGNVLCQYAAAGGLIVFASSCFLSWAYQDR